MHPPALTKADYSVIKRFLGGSLVRRCGTEAIYVRWIGGEKLKHCSTHGNLTCVGLHYLLNLNFYQRNDRAWNEVQWLLPPFSLCYSLIMMVLWWFPYTTRRKIRLGMLTEWISVGDTSAFKRYIVNTSMGAPLTDTACLDPRGCVCNEVKTIQGSPICIVMFIPWSHAGRTCVECCKDIRVLQYIDGQRNKRAAGTLASLPALRRLAVEDIGGATSFIRIKWKISYSNSFYRHPERTCANYWLLKLLTTISWYQQQTRALVLSSALYLCSQREKINICLVRTSNRGTS